MGVDNQDKNVSGILTLTLFSLILWVSNGNTRFIYFPAPGKACKILAIAVREAS